MPTSRWAAGLARGLAIGLPAAGAVLGLAFPASVLWGGLAWFGFLLAVLAGWGHLVARAARVEVDVGLRLAWGTAALLAVAGVLLAAGRLDVFAFRALCAIGLGLHAWRELTVREPSLVAGARRVAAAVRADPQLAVLWAALAALALVNLLGAIASTRANVYDDDIAYTPFVRRLLDVGNLDEPFSFRRLSAYGGQTVLSALAAARGTLANLYLVDHGLFQLITLALVAGMIRTRGLDRLVGALTILVLLLLPDASINTASYWSGVALFLALYRTVAHVDADARPAAVFAIAGLLAAATSTLRQNYIPVAVGFVAIVLLLRLRRPLWPSLRADRAAWLGALAGGLVGLVPYLIASWRSNHTFLYPLQLGTFNPNMPMAPTVWTGWQELQLFVDVILDPDPLRITVPLTPVLLLCRDRRRGRPLTALTIVSVLGFAMLVHSFAMADARNLWRYAFGYVVALTAVLALEGSAGGFAVDERARRARAPEVARPLLPVIGRFWIVACLLAQLASSAKSTARKYGTIGADLAAAARGGIAPDERDASPSAYHRLQAAAPAGATIAILLDEPAYLDYARNSIINIDTPGQSSYPPGMPYFRGAEAVAAYLREHGIHHVAFVRGDESRYFYRRDFWVARLLTDMEFWRIVGAYIVDLDDNLEELATRYAVLHEEGGMVLLDLDAPRGTP